MDKYIFEKQIFFTKYDMIRFDAITLNRSIDMIIKLENNMDEIFKIITYLHINIFQDNIREIIFIMKYLLKNDVNYTTQKFINGLKVIEKSIIKKKNEYCKYVDKICEL